MNLRWHGLRHAYASRLVERGVPLAQVRDLRGHASITTTERYDNQKLENLQVAAAKLESGLTFELPSPRQPNGEERPRRKPARKVSRIFQVPRDRASIAHRSRSACDRT
jgi:hypothetical protein